MNETTRSSPLYAFLSSLAWLYLLFAGSTTRIKTRNSPARTDFIYALWHSQLAFMIYAKRNTWISVLVSKSGDGEYVARILRKFGLNTIRGSTSRGASQSLMELMERAGKGFPVALTPDGPRGPKGKVQQGIVYLAQKTGMEILPGGVWLSNKITFNSWDNFELPLPFGKAALVYGNPIKVTATDSLPAKAAELEEALNALESEAMELLQ